MSLTNVVIFSMVPVMLWSIALLIHLAKRRLIKNCTCSTKGVIIDYHIVPTGDSYQFRNTIQYEINQQTILKDFQINRVRYIWKLPIGQIKGMPVGESVTLYYNPSRINQIYVQENHHFGKQFVIILLGFFATPLTILVILITLNQLKVIM